MSRFGLLGKTLSYSFSPQLQAMFGIPDYTLCEVPEQELASFLATTELRGMNVTIPYKKAVLPFCTSISETARKAGNVNLLLRRPDGWHGENADAFGFRFLLRSAAVDPAGKKCLIFGTGGAACTVRTVLTEAGAGEVVLISRRGENTYADLEKYADAELLVNATPVGTSPDLDASLADLTRLPRLKAVFDLIYNPLHTALLLQAERLGIPAYNGLGMLAAQAAESAALFGAAPVGETEIAAAAETVARNMRSLVLIGMPGCGKTAVGAELARRLGRPFVDTDVLLAERTGMPAGAYLKRFGEARFRAEETSVLRTIAPRLGCVIATGGGVVTRPENQTLLHQNGFLIHLKRDLDQLPVRDRPISQNTDLRELWAQRAPLYAAFADAEVFNECSVEETAAHLAEVYG